VRKLSLAEKILCLVTYQLETRQDYIREKKLKELLGNPPKSTYYRILKMLLDGSIEYRPLLCDTKEEGIEKKYQFFFDLKNKD